MVCVVPDITSDEGTDSEKELFERTISAVKRETGLEDVIMNENGVDRDDGNEKGVFGATNADELQPATMKASKQLKTGADRILEKEEGPQDPEIHSDFLKSKDVSSISPDKKAFANNNIVNTQNSMDQRLYQLEFEVKSNNAYMMLVEEMLSSSWTGKTEREDNRC